MAAVGVGRGAWSVERENRLPGARETWLVPLPPIQNQCTVRSRACCERLGKNPAAHKKGSAAADRPSCRQNQVADPDLCKPMVFSVDIGGSEPGTAMVNGYILIC